MEIFGRGSFLKVFYSNVLPGNSSFDSSVAYTGHPAAWQQASWLDWQQLGNRQLGKSGPRRQKQFIIWKELASGSISLGTDGNGTLATGN